MKPSRFTTVNEFFVCTWCGTSVQPLQTGCRNHCPMCLSSKHVDIFPGDRASLCHGRLKAIGYELNGKKGIVLNFRCCVCGFEGKNRAATDDPLQPDDYDVILALTKQH